MRLDDLRPTDNVEDRRGGFGGGPLMIGGGGLGLVAVVVLSLFFGVDPSQLLGGSQSVSQPGFQSEGQSSGPRQDDAAFEFTRKIVGSTEDVWSEIFAEQGRTYQPATFVPYDYATNTGCGGGQAAMGPFYCPADSRVYIDLSFFDELKSRFGAPGDFAQAYVIAHEVGHNVQANLGTEEQVRRQQQGLSESEGNRLSVRMELQADCYAGVWANRAQKKFNILEQGDVDEALKAASAVGDDTLEKAQQGYAVPDSFTHGTSEQRMRWFKRGMDNGKMEMCDTFSASDREL
jgi:predicted metalloprotease